MTRTGVEELAAAAPEAAYAGQLARSFAAAVSPASQASSPCWPDTTSGTAIRASAASGLERRTPAGPVHHRAASHPAAGPPGPDPATFIRYSRLARPPSP